MQVKELVDGLFDAFKYFNETLFDSTLPDVMIKISRKRGAAGVYTPDQFVPKDDNLNDVPVTSEITLNPDTFGDTETKILSTLVHEMVHLWQKCFGDPAKARNWHNQEWADKMRQVGLQASQTGRPGGKATGRPMTHYIIEGGAFDIKCADFMAKTGFLINWKTIPKVTKSHRKTTYTCPECGLRAWASKPDTFLICGACNITLKESNKDGTN